MGKSSQIFAIIVRLRFWDQIYDGNILSNNVSTKSVTSTNNSTNTSTSQEDIDTFLKWATSPQYIHHKNMDANNIG